MREALVEARLFSRVVGRGGIAKKIRFLRGWPDRFVLWPGGIIHWIECKKPKGSHYEPLQLRKHALLRRLGFVCAVVFNYEHIDEYMEYVERTVFSGEPQDPTFNPGRSYEE